MSELTIRPAKIGGVIPDSIAAEVGFEIGDALVSINGNRPRALTYKQRIMRRIKAQEHAVNLGYTFWKGDDQMKVMMDKYQERLAKLAGVIH